jgi:hypothetical protein
MDLTIIATMVQVGDKSTTHEAIKSYILTQAELFRTVASDKRRYILACKDADCGLKVQVWKSPKDIASIMDSSYLLSSNAL